VVVDTGADLVEEPLRRLVELDELVTYRYDGFWMALDTLKDLHDLHALHDSGRMPWAPWQA
jgi:glucose-1-phosphate cytidylyltransferase